MKKIVVGFVILILVYSQPSFASSRLISEDDLNYALSLSVPERLYLVKMTENGVTSKIKSMFSDPQNAKDTYLWARKVTSIEYASLCYLSNSLNLIDIGNYYCDLSNLFSDHVTGKVDTETLYSQEVKIKSKLKDNIIARMDNDMKWKQETINKLKLMATSLANKIHSVSVFTISWKR